MRDVHLPSLEWWTPKDDVCRLHVEALVVEDPWKMLVDGAHGVTCVGEDHVVTCVDGIHEMVVGDDEHVMVCVDDDP
jgi:hypothetical protein